MAIVTQYISSEIEAEKKVLRTSCNRGLSIDYKALYRKIMIETWLNLNKGHLTAKYTSKKLCILDGTLSQLFYVILMQTTYRPSTSLHCCMGGLPSIGVVAHLKHRVIFLSLKELDSRFSEPMH